jgi:segregation and condensation protein B
MSQHVEHSNDVHNVAATQPLQEEVDSTAAVAPTPLDEAQTVHIQTSAAPVAEAPVDVSACDASAGNVQPGSSEDQAPRANEVVTVAVTEPAQRLAAEAAPEAPDDAAAGSSAAEKGEQGNAPARLSPQEQVAAVEALLLAHGEPLGVGRLQELLQCTRSEVLVAAQRLQELCQAPERGFEVVLVAEKLQLRTKAAYGEFVRTLLAVKPRKLSQAALETLAVIAYRQPVVKSEVDKIRGVDGAPTIKTLVERGLIKILGYQASVGQPALYGTTDEFLKTFGLAALSELPTLRDLKALAREPGEAGEDEGEDSEAGASANLDAQDPSTAAGADTAEVGTAEVSVEPAQVVATEAATAAVATE